MPGPRLDAAMDRTAPLWLVVNAASGSNSDESVSVLKAALAAAGHPVARTLRCPDDPLPDPATLDGAGVGVLAIFAGDGTINHQVKAVLGWNGQVLVLPGGTQNLLAKAIHGDVPVEETVRRLGAGELASMRRPVVETSQGHALVEVVAGPATTWAEVREGLRDMDLPAIAGALGEAVRTTARGAPVRVTDPPMGRPEGYRAVRVDAGAGVLTIDGYDATDLSELAAHASNMIIRRDFRDGPHEKLGSAEAVTCRSDEPMALMLDGERFDGGTEERFASVSLPVNFLGLPLAAVRADR